MGGLEARPSSPRFGLIWPWEEKGERVGLCGLEKSTRVRSRISNRRQQPVDLIESSSSKCPIKECGVVELN